MSLLKKRGQANILTPHLSIFVRTFGSHGKNTGTHAQVKATLSEQTDWLTHTD